MGRLAEEGADVFFASDEASCVTGTAMSVDQGTANS